MARPRIRLEGLQACEIECNRLCAAGPDGQRGRWSDEPRRCGKGRGDEGCSPAVGHRARVGCVLPVSGRRRGSGETWDHGGDSTGGVGAGQRGDCGGGSAGAGDGVHRYPPLPALNFRAAIARERSLDRAIYFGFMPLLRRVGLRWILALTQSLFCIVLLADLFHANRQLQQPGSVFGATSSAPVMVFQELNLPVLFVVSVPKLWMEERWT